MALAETVAFLTLFMVVSMHIRMFAERISSDILSKTQSRPEDTLRKPD